jgi:hypothetical protein
MSILRKLILLYGWWAIAALLCLAMPSIFFVFDDSIAANAGKIPRLDILSGPSVLSAIVPLAEIMGGVCLWVTIIMTLHFHKHPKNI